MPPQPATPLRLGAVLRLVGLIGTVWALLVIASATLAYLPGHPDFSPFSTYLSDIGDTPHWPQILFNAGTLMSVPLRYAVLVLVVLRLRELGAGRAFATAALVVGFLSTAGTALMTATPFSVSPATHKSGIALYFFGVVVLQSIFFVREWSMKSVPRLLPALSGLLVVLFFVFATLVTLYERGVVSRSTPVIWEWACALSSIVWMLAHSLLLGRESPPAADRSGRGQAAPGG